MFGFSVSEQAQKLYEEGLELPIKFLKELETIPDEQMPDYVWTDAYMQGFFLTFVMQLRGFQMNGQPLHQPSQKDIEVVAEVFRKYLCPNHWDEVRGAAKRFQDGDAPDDWSIDDYGTACKHAVNVVGIMFGTLAPEFHNEPEIIEAKRRAQSNDIGYDLTSPYLFSIYMVNRISYLEKTEP